MTNKNLQRMMVLLSSLDKEPYENLQRMMVQLSSLDKEPYVELPNYDNFKNHSKELEVSINQNRRQLEKFKFFINSFDFLNDSQIYGDYLEFGIHKARTFKMALSCAKFYNINDISFHAFDSFEGLPDFGDPLIKSWSPNALCTTVDQFMSHIKDHGLYLDQINCHKGFFKDSLNNELKASFQNRKAMMITVDCDFYHSAVSVFEFIEPFLQHGTVIYLDDVFAGFTESSMGGVLQAFREFEDKSSFNFIPNQHIGWWGRSFIASKLVNPSNK